jgi:hypothetical protein
MLPRGYDRRYDLPEEWTIHEIRAEIRRQIEERKAA